MKEFKKYYLIRISITVVFWLVVGVALILTRRLANDFFDVLLIAMGLLMIAANLIPLVFSLRRIKEKGEWINALISLVAIGFGVILTLVPRGVILLYLGIFSILFPLLRILLVGERKKRIKKELPTFLFGIFMVLVSILQVEEKVFLVFGIAIAALSVLYFLFSLIRLKVTLALFAEPPAAELQQTEE